MSKQGRLVSGADTGGGYQVRVQGESVRSGRRGSVSGVDRSHNQGWRP